MVDGQGFQRMKRWLIVVLLKCIQPRKSLGLENSAEIGYHHKYENNCIPHTPDYFRRSLRPPQSSQKTVNVIHTTVTHNYQEEEEEEYMLVHCGLSVYSLKKSQMNFLEGRRARVSSAS
ncbi:hypothetical protein P8452_60126 [Trifolium repens]|nr:hypothetical protein P8452_60126 [Trifolium repens]